MGERLSQLRIEWLRSNTPLIVAIVNSLAWIAMVPVATLLRYDFDIEASIAPGIRGAILVALIAQLVSGLVIGTYRRKWILGTFDEVLAHVSSVLFAGAAVQIFAAVVGSSQVPRSVPTVATFLVVNVTVAGRTFIRLIKQRLVRRREAEPVVVVGAGNAAEQLLRTLTSDPGSPYIPVAMVDDSKSKQSLRISGVNVRGTIDDLPNVLSLLGVSTVLLAIPSAPPELTQRVLSLVEGQNATLLVLPRVGTMFGVVKLADIRPVSPEDLLGREPVEIDSSIASQFVSGRRVLVTGAGGSIGSELCRQLAQLQPAQLVMLDRDEGGLHSTQLMIDGNGLLDSPNIVLADIRDEARIQEVFEKFRPEVVFHAAALKHLPLLEQHPIEGWKTNVVGTYNVLNASESTGAQHVVNISTDKAANPESVLGMSKRMTEQLTSAFAAKTGRDWVSVRFGNVLGSRGSVLTSFHAQVKIGGPITVTHPDVTRFFMTVAEAVRLTIFAAAIGSGGQVLVLDMGQPVRILDVAKRFASMTSPSLEIVFTGLRPGEKLHEDLLGDGEEDIRPSHPLVTQVPVAPIEFHDLSPEHLTTGDKSIFN